MRNFLKPVSTTLSKLCYLFFTSMMPFLFSEMDLTIVGFLEPEGGIGKVPITIVEALNGKVSANFISTLQQVVKFEIPARMMNCLHNNDHTPGNIAILTEPVCHFHTDPYAHIPKDCKIKIAFSMLETTKIPTIWVKALNEKYDAVIVPDPYLKKVYFNSGVTIPIFVLPMPMVLGSFLASPIHSTHSSRSFVFGDASANKNPAVLIRAFAKAFGNDPNYQLAFRAGVIMPETKKIINDLTHELGLSNVTFESGHITEENFIKKLLSYDCYVNLSRGEGFSLIPREALALGLPVIITDNTASTTICKSGCVRAVPSIKKGPCNSCYQLLFHENCGKQFDCEVDDVVEALLDMVTNYDKYKKLARQGRKWVQQYDAANPDLQALYLTLVKPNKVILGKKDKITDSYIMTTSKKLYQKYMQVMH